MATGKAAVFFGVGKPFEIRELTLPDVEPEAVLIKVSLANICGSDLHFWRGDAPLRIPEDGWIFGHEMMGRVEKLGSKVKTDSLGRALREGDRVAYTYFVSCRRCPACLNNQPAACPNKIGRPLGPSTFPHFHGAFAEYYYLQPGGHVFTVPDELTDEMVSPVNCALSQVLFGLHQAGLRFGGSIVIQGAGGLGVQAAAVAKDMGAATIIVVDQVPGRLALAKAFGADHTIDLKEIPERKDRVALVRKLTGGYGADVACDFVGFPQVIPEGIEMLGPGGTYLEIGTISRGAKIELEPAQLVWGAKKIVGVIMYDPWVIPRALDFLVRNRTRFAFDRLISNTYPLEKINEAFAASERRGPAGPGSFCGLLGDERVSEYLHSSDDLKRVAASEHDALHASATRRPPAHRHDRGDRSRRRPLAPHASRAHRAARALRPHVRTR